MATSPYFFQTFRDPATDEPAAGGKMHIYAQGSAVHANIWLDAAESVSAPNPLTLDPVGAVQQYFVTDGQALDYKVFTSDGRTIVTALNVTANGGNGGGTDGPWLPLAGEKRVSGWVAFDATVYGTVIDMRVFNLTQAGLELKTGTRIYGGGTMEIESSVYMDDPCALTLSVDSLGYGPGGVTPINSTHLVGRDPATGLLLPVELDIGVGYQNFNAVTVDDDALAVAWFPAQPEDPIAPIGTPTLDQQTGGRAAISGVFLAVTPSGHALSIQIGIGTEASPQQIASIASGALGTSAGSDQSFRIEFEWRPIQRYAAGVYNCLYSIIGYLDGTASTRRFGSFVWDSATNQDPAQIWVGTVVGGDFNHARLDSMVVEKASIIGADEFVGIGQKGAANGVAALGGDGKVPWAQIPSSLRSYIATIKAVPAYTLTSVLPAPITIPAGFLRQGSQLNVRFLIDSGVSGASNQFQWFIDGVSESGGTFNTRQTTDLRMQATREEGGVLFSRAEFRYSNGYNFTSALVSLDPDVSHTIDIQISVASATTVTVREYEITISDAPIPGVVPGTLDDSDAPTGCVGEPLSSELTSSIVLSSGVSKTLTYLDLTPGNWIVWGVAPFNTDYTFTAEGYYHYCSLSLIDNGDDLKFVAPMWFPNGYNASLVGKSGVPPHRPVKVPAGTTTRVYLTAHLEFSAGSCRMFANLYARRVR